MSPTVVSSATSAALLVSITVDGEGFTEDCSAVELVGGPRIGGTASLDVTHISCVLIEHW